MTREELARTIALALTDEEAAKVSNVVEELKQALREHAEACEGVQPIANADLVDYLQAHLGRWKLLAETVDDVDSIRDEVKHVLAGILPHLPEKIAEAMIPEGTPFRDYMLGRDKPFPQPN